ncbi:MAG: hypothetical protein ACXWB2_06660 [Acidimicrobiales bacterium]
MDIGGPELLIIALVLGVLAIPIAVIVTLVVVLGSRRRNEPPPPPPAPR